MAFMGLISLVKTGGTDKKSTVKAESNGIVCVGSFRILEAHMVEILAEVIRIGRAGTCVRCLILKETLDGGESLIEAFLRSGVCCCLRCCTHLSERIDDD